MKKRLLTLCLCIAIFVGIFQISVSATVNTEDIVILYENDVHCSVEGYSKLSALKKELKETYANVGVVSSGDYVQGSTLGVVSKGENIVNLMNLIGYDALTLGNHEFDYRIDRLHELVEIMNTKPVCCNFEKIGEGKTVFEPFSIVEYGATKIAYVGVTTPSTISSSSPRQFRDDDGNYIYTFHPENLYETVQKSVDSAVEAGADYVIALTHVGDTEILYDTEEMIAATKGIDAVLDGHSHSVIEGRIIKNSEGEDVVLTSTGTRFEHIGRLTISNGKITTELIKTETLTKTDPVIDACLADIAKSQEELGGRVVGTCDFDLVTHDENGNRIIRLRETNLGDLCADAFRSSVDADIGFCNGGGIRAPIEAGQITFNDLLNVLQYNNTIVHVEVSGRFIKDMLELTLDDLPNECGTFPHVSGMTFSVNTSIDTSVIIDKNENFVKIDGPYRVYNIKVLNRETGKYEPIDLEKNYTLAISNYYALEYGGGMTMFEDVKILRNDGTLDVEALENYISEDLGGVVGKQYATVQQNITFTDGEIALPDENTDTEPATPESNDTEKKETDASEEESGCGSYISITAFSMMGALAALALVKKKRK